MAIRNPLTYPTGTASGFDRTHVAARGILFSGIASGGNALNVLTGQAGTVTGSPTAGISAKLGRASLFPTSPASYTTFPSGVAVPRTGDGWKCTIAGIFTQADSNSFFAQAFLSSSFTAGTGVSLQTNNSILNWGAPGYSGGSLGVTIPTGSTVFVAASSLGVDSQPTSVNYAVVFLDNGKVISGSANGFFRGNTGDGTLVFGADSTGNHNAASGVAAAMLSNAYHPLATLQAWATDPWSFWYPQRRAIFRGAAAAGGSFIPAWAIPSNYVSNGGYAT